MRIAARWFALCLATTLAGGGAARAQTSEERESARIHFESGKRYYGQGRYEDALREFSESHRLTRLPALLYNMGVACQAMQRLSDARGYFRRYLDESPAESPDRAEAEARLRAVEEGLAAGNGPAVATPPPAPAAKEPPQPAVAAGTSPREQAHERRVPAWVTWTAAGVSVAAAGTGVALGLSARSAASDWGAAGDAGAYADAGDRAEARALGASVAFGVAGAAAVTAVVLWWIDR